MHIHMKKVLATDLDGTLFYPRRRFRLISKRNVNFLRRYIDDGGRVALITGRSQDFIKKVEKKIARPIDSMSCNGANMMVDAKMVRQKYMSGEDVQGVIDYMDEKYHPLAYIIMTDSFPSIVAAKRRNIFLKLMYRIWYFFQFSYAEKYTFSDRNKVDGLFNSQLKTDKISKLLIFMGLRKKYIELNKEVNKELRAKFSHLEFSWSNQVIEITPSGAEKSKAISEYLRHLNISNEDCFVAGDSGNDITMFETFKHNVCMAHASNTVKKYATHIVKHYYDIARFIYEEDKEY